MRASARQSFTYSSRWLGAAAVMGVCVGTVLGPGFAHGSGGRVFGLLHFTLFCSIWILVPLLTADCLSRERREGTLPLLFLTRLTPRGWRRGCARCRSGWRCSR